MHMRAQRNRDSYAGHAASRPRAQGSTGAPAVASQLFSKMAGRAVAAENTPIFQKPSIKVCSLTHIGSIMTVGPLNHIGSIIKVGFLNHIGIIVMVSGTYLIQSFWKIWVETSGLAARAPPAANSSSACLCNGRRQWACKENAQKGYNSQLQGH